METQQQQQQEVEEEVDDDDDYYYLQHIETPLHACSLETFPHPMEPSFWGNEEDHGRITWPMMVGCYELDPDTRQRKGHLDLYAVSMVQQKEEDDDNNDNNNNNNNTTLFLDPPFTVLGPSNDEGDDHGSHVSGILDGQWCSYVSNNDCDSNVHRTRSPILYATAHATGEIQVHSVERRRSAIEEPTLPEETNHHDTAKDTISPWHVSKVGQSEVQEDALCLSLSWDTPRHDDDPEGCVRRNIISSYSDGHVAIHKVHVRQTKDDNDHHHNNHQVELEEIHSWAAHKMFTSPAEVWTASFTTHDQIVLTGGDEGQCKIWDLRLMGTSSSPASCRPIHSLSFDAGVTVLSPHPRREHWIACGSYDETVRIWDLRRISSHQTPQTLCHSEPQGGGIWRIKWHPHNDNRLLLGAMHGGCRIVDLVTQQQDGDDDKPALLELRCHQSFTRHKSMAYGADWLVSSSMEMAASCSFYDKALYIWRVNNNIAKS